MLRRGDAVESVEVPAGTFRAEVRTVEVEGGRTWTFHVEQAAPHRIVRWTTSDGQKAELVRSKRMPYWQLNGNADVEALGEIGLEARPERTP